MIESVFYERNIDALVEDVTRMLDAGESREFILHDLTALLLRELDTPEKTASLAAMAIVMISEERR
jgi:hypothetical protein